MSTDSSIGISAVVAQQLHNLLLAFIWSQSKRTAVVLAGTIKIGILVGQQHLPTVLLALMELEH